MKPREARAHEPRRRPANWHDVPGRHALLPRGAAPPPPVPSDTWSRTRQPSGAVVNLPTQPVLLWAFVAGGPLPDGA